MQPLLGQRDQGAPDAIPAAFLIPDLCAPRAVFILVLLAQLMVLVFTLMNSALPAFNWDLFARASFSVQWIMLASVALLCPLRRFLSRVSVAVAVMVSLLVVIMVTVASSLVIGETLPGVSYNREGMWWVIRNVLVATVVSGITLRYFYLQQQLRLREQSELQARLDSLQARIRPHFLFNTMNSIASLIGSRPDDAEQAVEDLSELFRVSLSEENRFTTIADELHLCELYLGIEQLRLGSRLSVAWQVDPAVKRVPMPGLMLQPLMENAIYHGIAQLPQGGTIKVSVSREGEKIHVSVDNPTPEQPRQAVGHHMALGNIEQRLTGLYGGDARVEISHIDNIFRADLYYPAGASL
jgi:two-component system, LytTR family, sensor histidine kinase AlgZ